MLRYLFCSENIKEKQLNCRSDKETEVVFFILMYHEKLLNLSCKETGIVANI